MYDGYELELCGLNTKISSSHGELISKQGSNNNGSMLTFLYFNDPHKEPGGTDIDALANDDGVNNDNKVDDDTTDIYNNNNNVYRADNQLVYKLYQLVYKLKIDFLRSPNDEELISTESNASTFRSPRYCDEIVFCKTSPPAYGTGTHNGEANISAPNESKETKAMDNDDAAIDFHLGTLFNEFNKFFLSEATKEDLTKGVIATTKRKNYTLSPLFIHIIQICIIIIFAVVSPGNMFSLMNFSLMKAFTIGLLGNTLSLVKKYFNKCFPTYKYNRIQLLIILIHSPQYG